MDFSEKSIVLSVIQAFHQNAVATSVAKSDSALKNVEIEDVYCSPELPASSPDNVQKNSNQDFPLRLPSTILVIKDSNGNQYFLSQSSYDPETKHKNNLSNNQTEKYSESSGTLLNPKLQNSTESGNSSHQVTSTEGSSSNKGQTLADILKPLYKYIVDNKCQLCGFVSKSKGIYRVRRHLATHLKTMNFKCDVCGKFFRTPACLQSHKFVHDDVPRYPCEECGKKFRHQEYRANHVCLKHNNVKKYVCSMCDLSFMLSSKLKEHLRIHTGEKPYECAVCKKCFRTNSMMKNHLASHSSQKRYPCEICNRSYNRKRLLKEHINTHKVVSAYACEVCGKKFNFRSNLSQHMLVHNDSRRHTCETCGMKFKLPHHLRSHILTHESS